MIAFLIDKINPRWEYTFDFIFEIRSIKYKLFDNKEAFLNSDHQKVEISESQGVLLRLDDIQHTISGDDLLSNIFFVLTRMEEYQGKNLDVHGRFSAKDSWQHKNDCLQSCICDRWAVEFIQSIEEKLDLDLGMRKPKVEVIPTFDIDNAFAYKYKKGLRKVLSSAKDIVKGNSERGKERADVLAGKMEDPYDAYVFIQNIASSFPVRLFWLIGDYGKPDFNISIETPEIQNLVKDLKRTMIIGIHPSYRSNSKPELLGKEIDRLQSVLEDKVKISRQHFLKLSLPETYNNLLQNGINEDYSMGFADEVGFRNGTAQPFPWFDLSKNQRTELIVYPFAYMDGTLNEYLNISPLEANQKIDELNKEVEKYGGQFSFIWHNETITDYKKWNGWSEVLKYTLTLQA